MDGFLFTCICDATDCRIEKINYKNWEYQYEFYNQYKGFHSLRYNVIISLKKVFFFLIIRDIFWFQMVHF
jgi:hypothetical protein